MSKLEKICAAIVGVSTVIWLFADHHHSQVALATLEDEVTRVERALGEDEADAIARRDALLESLGETQRRWIQSEVAALEARLRAATSR